MHGFPCFILIWDFKPGQEPWCKKKEFHRQHEKQTVQQLKNKARRFRKYLKRHHFSGKMVIVWA